MSLAVSAYRYYRQKDHRHHLQRRTKNLLKPLCEETEEETNIKALKECQKRHKKTKVLSPTDKLRRVTHGLHEVLG